MNVRPVPGLGGARDDGGPVRGPEHGVDLLLQLLSVAGRAGVAVMTPPAEERVVWGQVHRRRLERELAAYFEAVAHLALVASAVVAAPSASSA